MKPFRPADNPFRSQRVDALAYRHPLFSWPEKLAELQALDYRAAIVGDHGHGKTTLLHELERRLLAAGLPAKLVQVSPACRLEELRERDTLWLIDRFESLAGWRARRVFRRTRRHRGLVVTLHDESWLPTWHSAETGVEILEQLVAELAPELDLLERLPELFARHDGDIRQCLRELYDVCAAGDGPDRVR